MFIPKLNSKCIFKYPFDGGKKLHIFFCLATADLISIIVLPTNYSKVQ